jgi:Putative amidase domain
MRNQLAFATLAAALLIAPSALASSNQTVSPRDNCGGFNGHVVVSDGSTPTLQLYGEVWDNNCPGATSVWLAWQSPGYHNIQVQAADEPATIGVNYTTGPLQARPADIEVTVCSTYGAWHCGTPVTVPDASDVSSGSSPAPSQGPAPTQGPATPPQATNGSGRELIPGTKVDLAGAASWALNNVFGSPGLFGPDDGFGDDCTDFVSRALAIGGGDPETVLSARSTTNDRYWYFSTFRFGRWWSHSWSVAEDLAVHLNLLHSTWLRYWRDARPGDVIFVDWTSSSFAHIDHVGIVTGMKGGEPLITQHTPAQRGVTLHYWQTHPPALVNGRPNVHVWIAVPNAD